GAGKADIVEEINISPAKVLPYQAAKIHAKSGLTEWYLDFDAAEKIA
ncbi:6-phosphogluconolactonase, partial [Vibrio parahaemolyticus]|nr:6-phosphogluconolactonase [Vibrio parahaemolyticus]